MLLHDIGLFNDAFWSEEYTCEVYAGISDHGAVLFSLNLNRSKPLTALTTKIPVFTRRNEEAGLCLPDLLSKKFPDKAKPPNIMVDQLWTHLSPLSRFTHQN